MPLYAYLCQECGPFELQRPMKQFDQPANCPRCLASAPRMVTAVQLNLMPGNNRIAHTRNERNAHEPRVASPHSACGHHHGGHDKHGQHTHNHDHHHKRHVSSRPWQVGH